MFEATTEAGLALKHKFLSHRTLGSKDLEATRTFYMEFLGLDVETDADVAGYSRRMGEDEVGTRSRFNAHLHELIEPAIASRRGRIVKTIGDGLLVEFSSVVVNREGGIWDRRDGFPNPPDALRDACDGSHHGASRAFPDKLGKPPYGRHMLDSIH